MKKFAILLTLFLVSCTAAEPKPVHTKYSRLPVSHPEYQTTYTAAEPKPVHTKYSRLPVSHPEYQTTYTPEYTSGAVDPADVDGLQCPIPYENRVRNRTGTQCVFASLEMLARWAECEKLLQPEILTRRSGCQTFSSPTHAAQMMDKFGVRYENSYRMKEEGRKLIRKAMAEGRGALFGVPGHAMVLVHYDEEANVAKWVDNSDSSLRVQTTDIASFDRRWDTWVMVIYDEPDVTFQKSRRLRLAPL